MRDTIFSPSFGNRPNKLVGRDGIVQTLVSGLNTKPGNRERSVVMLGQRGSGKTVTLWEIADHARENGFVVATPTIASEGMLERIVEKIQDAGEAYVERNKKHVSGGSVGVLGFSAGLQFSPEIQETKTFQYKLIQLVRKLSAQEIGTLILVDELQANSSDIKQLVIAFQEMVGEGLNVALIMAGLPGAVAATLNDKVLTFLNRASKVPLEALSDVDVDAFFKNAFDELGIELKEDLRQMAVSAIGGSPYLLQLIGHNLVVYSDADNTIDEDVVHLAIQTAQNDYKNDICKTSLSSLSDGDRAFLYAMASLGTPAKMKDIADVLDKTSDYAQKYRIRLIDSGIIESPERGKVSFAVPYLEDYLQEERES